MTPFLMFRKESPLWKGTVLSRPDVLTEDLTLMSASTDDSLNRICLSGFGRFRRRREGHQMSRAGVLRSVRRSIHI
jgi:hypothetical protein